MASKNLWGDLSQVTIARSPKKVLQEQAEILTDATRGALVGVVSNLRDVPANKFRYELYIQVPALNHYLVTILWIEHDIEPYPVRLGSSRPAKDVSCSNESELEAAVESVLSSPEVRAIRSHLLSQIQ